MSPGRDLRDRAFTRPSSLIPHPSSRRWLVLLCLIALPLFFAGLCHRGFTDNEGMYAEIGREILVSGDWVTPHINGQAYLNKPPLLFWLVALVLRIAGLTELPRLISGLASLGTMLLVYDLGRRLWPERPTAGVWAAAVYLSCALTPVEARVLRPDSLLAFLVALTLWGVVRVNTERVVSDRLGVAAIWGGIGLGVMDKGLVGLLLPALAFLPALWLGRQWNDLRRYCPAWGLGLAAVIVLPWHIAAGMANPGFWWDYVVNQHLLYFFDRKFPRDSVPHPLGFAWGAFAGRLTPWVLLLPAALVGQYRRARERSCVAAWLPLTWLGMIWLFFSASKGRLEHYFLPAVPAAALLVGSLCAAWASAPHGKERGMRDKGRGMRNEERGASNEVRPRHLSVHSPHPSSLIPHPSSLIPRSSRWRVLPFLIIGLAALGGLMAAPGLMRSYGVQETAPALLWIGEAAFGVVAVGSLAAAVLTWAGRYAVALGTLATTFLIFGGLACRGLAATDPLVSPRQLVSQMDPLLLSRSTVAYQAGTEYQLCGGLNFYLRRRLLLLEPPGFIAPTYLQHDLDRLFVKPDRFWSAWRRAQSRFLLFSDPDRPGQRLSDFPAPRYEVGRGGDRLVLTNLPLPSRLARGPWRVVNRIARP